MKSAPIVKDAWTPEGRAHANSAVNSVSVSGGLVTVVDRGGAPAESVRQLRTRIIAQHLNRGRRALVFCSPGVGSGCSFIAANTAVAFAQIGVRVLFINGDLRSANSGAIFGTDTQRPGLLQFLSAPAEEQPPLIDCSAVSGLSLMTHGGAADNAQELLSSGRFARLMTQCLREFELTIIDSPPANLYADAQRLASLAGYAAIVAKSNATYFADIGVLGRQLTADGVTVVGTILNDA